MNLKRIDHKCLMDAFSKNIQQPIGTITVAAINTLAKASMAYL